MTVNSSFEYFSDCLPPLECCSSLMLTAGDTFIVSPGFEDRTMAFSEVIHTSSDARAIILEYKPYDPNNRLSDVKLVFSGFGIEISNNDILEYDRFMPGDFENRLYRRLLVHKSSRIIVDISTMSKLEIILVLGVCKKINADVIIFYAEAEVYGPSQLEFEDARKKEKIHQPSLQIFTGVHGVVRVNSLASVAMQGQPTAAIVFMSFNDALTQVLLNTVYPSRLFLINSRPPVHTWREEATAWIHEQVRREWEYDNPVDKSTGNVLRVASTFDYRETVSLLLQLYWELSVNHRILLAPAGSKLQALGCFLAKTLHPDIHIEYPSPKGFFPHYSSGIGGKWMISFGRISERISAISKAERRKYLEIQA